QTRPKNEAERRAWADKVYKEAVLNHDSLQLAEAYYLRGKLEAMTTGNYLRTRVWYLKSLWILEKYGPAYELARLHIRLGSVEQAEGNYSQALMHYHKALEISEACDSDRGRTNTWTHLGNFYADYNETSADNGKYNLYVNFDSAAVYYDKAEQLVLKTRNKEGLVEIATAKEKLSMMQGKAVDHSRMSRVNLSVTGQRNVVEIRTLLRLAESFTGKKDFEEALKRLDKAKKIKEEYLPFDLVTDRLTTASYISFYEKQGRWEDAYVLHKQQLDKERRQRIAFNQAKDVSEFREFYEAEQKEIVLQSQEQELKLYGDNIRLQQRSLGIMALLFVMTVLSSILFYRLYRKNRSISRQNALLVKEQSHRFRNHLQVVSDLLSMQSSRLDAAGARQAMEDSHSRLEAISVLHGKLYRKDKLNTLQLDRFIEEIVRGVLKAFDFNHVEVSCGVKPVEITPDEALSLGLIISELTTNACKYAFAGHPAPRYEIFADTSGQELILRVIDNGFGRNKTVFGTSFGMKIIALQVSQLKGEHRFYEDNGWAFEMRYKRYKSVLNVFNNNPETV
ncbi:MAG: sensor histidine kinase, partial [Leadbetterella sp.]|nr:sensor histidine kinase [Leadbetterella sp.]